MNQVIPFNQAQGGNTANFCLYNVCKGYGISNKFASAWDAWLNTEQHAGEPPTGLDVPVFFSYTATIDGVNKNWGHIGVRLSNGQFWSDGKVYKSIGDYTANHSPKYVGWGESVNNVKVIQGDDDMVDDATARAMLQATTLLAVDGTGEPRQPTKQEVENLIGRTPLDALNRIMSYQPWKDNLGKVVYYKQDVGAGAVQLKPGKYLVS